MSADETTLTARKPRSAVHVIDDIRQARILSDPLRLNILKAFADQPRTTKQVADQLSVPPTRLYHHVEALEQAGLIELIDERRKRGTTERYFQAIARVFRASSDLFGEIADSGRELVTAASQAMRQAASDIGKLDSEAMDEDGSALCAVLEITAAPTTIKRVERRVRQLMDDLIKLAEDEDDGDAETRKIVLALFPPAE